MAFIKQHEGSAAVPPEQNYIQLDVYGRSNVAYRWAGETDVFEALRAVQQQYNIDPKRIALRGFSMGGAGVWHVGLHHPDEWAVFEAGAGYQRDQNLCEEDRLAFLPGGRAALLRCHGLFVQRHERSLRRVRR